MTQSASEATLGTVLKQARERGGLSLRDVERQTGIRSGHLSQIETDTIAKPEMALLWELAAALDLDFADLLRRAGHVRDDTSERQRRRTTVALRAMHELTPGEQEEALRFMAYLKARRGDG